jgi:glycosyltransferase involved in cell wall biosynthesis
VTGGGRRLLLELQRRLSWIPAPLRRRARALFGGDLESEPSVDDWSTPLAARPGDGALRWPTPDAGVAAATTTTTPPAARPELRCLLVTESVDASGMDEFVGFLARRLRSHGIHTAVMVASDDRGKGIGGIGRALLAEGIEVVDPGRAGCAAWMRAWRPDVLSVHGSADWPLESAAELGIPVVETLHGMHNLFDATLADVLRRRSLVSGFVSVSEMVRLQYLALDSELDPERIVTIPNGVDASRVRSVPRDRAREALGLTDEFLFVSLARHSLQKNGYALASAFDEVAAAARRVATSAAAPTTGRMPARSSP